MRARCLLWLVPVMLAAWLVGYAIMRAVEPLALTSEAYRACRR